MTIEEREKIILEFLSELDKQGFINKIDFELFHDDFTQNFPNTINGANSVLTTIIDHHVNGRTNFEVSAEEMTIFICFYGVSLVNAFLEFTKKMLLILIDKDKIGNGEFMTYGKLISILTDQLGIKNTKGEILQENFFVKYRNAISHIDYYITGEGIHFKIDNEVKKYNVDEFNEIVLEIKAVAEAIMKFIGNKTQELDRKANELDKQFEELSQEIKRIENLNLEQHKKTLNMKSETKKIISKTKRKEREVEKIHKNTELLERAKKRDRRNNARIVSKS